jgi:hypothetical protein
VTEKLLTSWTLFRDAIRGHIKNNSFGCCPTSFSTRTIVQLCDVYRVLKDLPATIYHSVYLKLMEEEKSIYNEQCVAIFGVDMEREFGEDGEMDYC